MARKPRGKPSAAGSPDPEFVRLKQKGIEQQELIRELEIKAVHMESEIFLRAQEIQQANASLRSANEELASREAELSVVNKDLKAFTSYAAHDLRAPLRRIAGFTRLLEMDFGASLSPNALQYLETIRAQSARMDRVINDLLSFSRVSRVRIERSEIDMGTLARSVFEEVIAASPKPPADFVLEAPPPARGDPSLIRQVILNLLSNAVKFTLRRTRRRIVVGGGREDGRNRYYVRDNGEGFNMRKAGKLFEPFIRLHAGKDFEGAGLGLAIVQRIIEHHGGRSWAEANPRKGASFFFTLPAAGRNKGSPPPAQASSTGTCEKPQRHDDQGRRRGKMGRRA